MKSSVKMENSSGNHTHAFQVILGLPSKFRFGQARISIHGDDVSSSSLLHDVGYTHF